MALSLLTTHCPGFHRGHSVLRWALVPWCMISLLHDLYPSCQVRHLYDTGDTKDVHLEMENLVNSRTTPKLARNGEPWFGLSADSACSVRRLGRGVHSARQDGMGCDCSAPWYTSQPHSQEMAGKPGLRGHEGVERNWIHAVERAGCVWGPLRARASQGLQERSWQRGVASTLRTTRLRDTVAEAGPALHSVCGAASEAFFGGRVTGHCR